MFKVNNRDTRTTKLVNANVSFRSEKWFLVSFIRSKMLMFKFPIAIKFSYWFTIRLRLLDICSKKDFFSKYGGI